MASTTNQFSITSPLGDPPADWKIVQIRDIALKVGSGATPSGGAATYLDHRENYALIRSQNVFDRKFSDEGLAYITDDQAQGLANARVQADDILLNITGDGVTFGRTCIVPECVLPACVNQHVSIIRVDQRHYDPGYLLSYLTHPQIKQYIESFNAGGSRRAVTKGHIESFVVPLPPLPEQRAIASILGALDDKIELNRRMNRTLEAITQALFQSWFVNFDPVRAKAEGRDPGLPAEIADLFPDGFEESELGEIPQGWTVESVSSAFDVNPSRTLSKGQTAPYLDMANMPTSGHHPENWTERPFGSGMRFVNGDTLLARITPCLENGKTAFVDFMRDDQIGWGSTEYIVMRPKPPVPVEFAYFLARQESFRAHVIQNMTGTSGRQRASSACLDHYLITLPPEKIGRYFGEVAQTIMAKIKANATQSRTLAALRDTLLPKLLSGELRVGEGRSQAFAKSLASAG